MIAPHLLELNGHCGGIAPQPLDLMIGTSAVCPTAAGLSDQDVLLWATMVQSPNGPGLLSGVPRASMPPFERALCSAADGWWQTFKAGEPDPTVVLFRS